MKVSTTRTALSPMMNPLLPPARVEIAAWMPLPIGLIVNTCGCDGATCDWADCDAGCVWGKAEAAMPMIKTTSLSMAGNCNKQRFLHGCARQRDFQKLHGSLLVCGCESLLVSTSIQPRAPTVDCFLLR